MKCSLSSKMKRRSGWLTRVKSAVAVGLLLLGGEGVPCCLPRRYLSACASMSYNPVEKVSGALRALSPSIAFAFIHFAYSFSAYALQKQNDTPLEENKRTSTKSLCGSSSQHIHRRDNENIWHAWSSSTVSWQLNEVSLIAVNTIVSY